jgi:ureidoglycolate dehydrogenase (NAD+)
LRARDAALVMDSLVAASLRGIDSHGVARLPHYLRRLELRSINPRPQLSFASVAPACGLVEGDHGSGQLVMDRAAREAIRLARQTGAGWVAVCDSSHCGELDYFGLRIARAGMIGLVFTHVDALVLPHGSRERFCGTNPICIAVPGPGRDGLCLDMATSLVAWNVVANAALAGVRVPRGWAVDRHGRGTTDPQRAAALLPVGGYKGSGLGLMIEVLCALLSGAPYGPDVPRMYEQLDQHRRLGGLVGAIAIQPFLPVRSFRARVVELLARWNQLPPVKSGGRVLYPGQRETECACERRQVGIPIPEHLLAAFRDWSRAHHIRPPA